MILLRLLIRLQIKYYRWLFKRATRKYGYVPHKEVNEGDNERMRISTLKHEKELKEKKKL
jgi:hypothetical protein